MSDVGAVVEFRQHAEKPEAADWSPANEFDETVGGIGVGRNQHGAAGEFAVVEGEEKAAAGVPFLFVIAAQDECAALQLRDADENAEEIAEMTEWLEDSVGESTDVSGETYTKNVEGINFAAGVLEANQIHGTGAIGEKRVKRGLGAMVCEIAQERVAGAKRKKTERDALGGRPSCENAVQDFMGGSVAADCQKFAIALAISFAGKMNGMPGASRSDDVDWQTLFAQAGKGRTSKLGRFAATGCGVDDGQKAARAQSRGWRGHWD